MLGVYGHTGGVSDRVERRRPSPGVGKSRST